MSVRTKARGVAGAAVAHGHPAHAVRYVTGGSAARERGDDRTAAIVWAIIAIVVLKGIRDGKWPTPRQAATIVGGGFLVVLAGEIAPDLVFWSLVALLVAALLVDEPFLAAAIAQAQERIGGLGSFGWPAGP